MAEEKRKISVGVLEPKDCGPEDDTIYVTLSQHGECISAKAVSRIKFTFDKDGKKLEGLETDNYRGHSDEGGPLYGCPWTFIRSLETKNDGKMNQYRVITEALCMKDLNNKHRREISDIIGDY